VSVLACKIYDDGFVMGSDSITCRGEFMDVGRELKFTKMFEVNDTVVGSSGTAEEIAMLRLFMETHKISEVSEKAVFNFINEFVSWKNVKTSKFCLDNWYLIGMENKVYYIENFFVSEVKEHTAIGAGFEYALTALYLGHDVYDSLAAAAELSIWCSQPIKIIDKRNEKYKK
jgi:hypothetical protein